MTRLADRQKAIELRKLGRTYTEIRKKLQVPKSTLSDWLSNYPLNQKQLNLLNQSKLHSRLIGIEKTRLVKQKKRKERLQETYTNQKKRWNSLSKRELELAGLFLYWGEGSKRIDGPVSLNNTDPQVLKFTLYWLESGLGVLKSKIKVFLHLYNDMNTNESIDFWSKELFIPASQFTKPYIKPTKRAAIDHKGYGYGTCTLVVNDVRLKEKVMMSIKAIADHYSDVVNYQH